MSDDVDILKDELADAIDEVLEESMDIDDFEVDFSQSSGNEWMFTITFVPDALDNLARASELDDDEQDE